MSTKQVQGKLWSVAPENWSRHFEPFFMPLYKKTLAEVSLSGDSSLLDAGCGSGLFSHLALRTGAHVMGVDAAPGLLDLARERNPGTNFLEEDLESLPFTDNSFDVVTGFNSFQYAGDFTSALRETHRVLKKGGYLVIAIWDKPERSEATEVLKAIGSHLPPPPAGTPGPFALSEDGRIETICDQIGLTLLNRSRIPCPFNYYSTDEAVKSFMGTGPAAAALNLVSRETVENTIVKAMQPYRLSEDMYHLQNSFLLFIAQK